MKTLFKIVGFFLLLSLFQQCDTEIPEVDNTLPTFSLRISGDGFNQTFTQDDIEDFQMNLRSNTTYSVALVSNDEGGIKYSRLVWFTGFMNFTSALPEGWTTDSDAISTLVHWQGDSNNAVTGNLFTGTFTTSTVEQGVAEGIEFKAIVQDWNNNTTTKALSILLGNHPTEAIEF